MNTSPEGKLAAKSFSSFKYIPIVEAMEKESQ